MTYRRFLPVVLGMLVLRSSGGLDAPVNLPSALIDANRKGKEVMARSLSNLVADLRCGFVRATEIDAGDSQDLPCPPSVGMSPLFCRLPNAVARLVALVVLDFPSTSSLFSVSLTKTPFRAACARASAIAG